MFFQVNSVDTNRTNQVIVVLISNLHRFSAAAQRGAGVRTDRRCLKPDRSEQEYMSLNHTTHPPEDPSFRGTNS
jgi:hypothetical protein